MAHRNNLAQEMLEHVTCQSMSGISIANYARQVGIAPDKLQYWVRKFKAQEAGKDTNLKFFDLNSFDTTNNHSTSKRTPKTHTYNPNITLYFPMQP